MVAIRKQHLSGADKADEKLYLLTKRHIPNFVTTKRNFLINLNIRVLSGSLCFNFLDVQCCSNLCAYLNRLSCLEALTF